MTKSSNIMTIVMMALVVITTTINPSSAEAGLKERILRKAKQTAAWGSKKVDEAREAGKEKAKEKFLEEADEKSAGAASALVKFFHEGRWLEFSNYSDQTRLFIGWLMLTLFYFRYYYKVGDKPAGPLTAIGWFIFLLILAIGFEFWGYTTFMLEYRQPTIWFIFALAGFAFCYRWESHRDFFIAMRHGWTSRIHFLQNFHHGLNDEEELEDEFTTEKAETPKPESKTTSTTCPSCKNTVTSGQVYCRKCGTKLKG